MATGWEYLGMSPVPHLSCVPRFVLSQSSELVMSGIFQCSMQSHHYTMTLALYHSRLAAPCDDTTLSAEGKHMCGNSKCFKCAARGKEIKAETWPMSHRSLHGHDRKAAGKAASETAGRKHLPRPDAIQQASGALEEQQAPPRSSW